MGIFTFIKPFFVLKVSIIFWVKFLHLISEEEEEVIWAVTKQMKSTQKLHLKHLDVFTHCLMQDINACMINVLIY